MLNLIQSIIILSSIFILVFLTNKYYLKYNNIKNNNNLLMKNTMGSIFLLFGLLKLLNLEGFKNIFKKYDLIAMNYDEYSYIYPFIELYFSYNLFLNRNITFTIYTIILFMTINIISVILSMYEGTELRCGCMGALSLHIPLSYTTLAENIFMIIMSILIL